MRNPRPTCPNASCVNHTKPPAGFYRKKGHLRAQGVRAPGDDRRIPADGGATQVQFHTLQPAWLSAVFAGASEPEFWKHLAGAGGPPNAAQALAHIDGKLGNVVDLFRPSVALSDEEVSQLLETAAQWRAQAMDAALDASAVVQRPRRF